MSPSHDRDRGVISPLSHALTVGMTTILLFGLIVGAGSLLENQREQAAESELYTIGNRLANEIATADSLADRGGNISMTSTQPGRIGGSDYSVTLYTGSECDRNRFSTQACLRLKESSPDVTVYVPVRNDTAVTLDSLGDGRFRVTATGTESVTAGSGRSTSATNELRTTVGVAANAFTDSPLDTKLGNRPPVSDFEFDPAVPEDGSEITFDATGSFDPDGDIDTYRWDWDGDGAVDETTTTPVVTRSFPAGSYDVTLTVADDNGAKSSFTRFIDVSGLVYNNDLDVTAASDKAVEFTVTNNFTSGVTITHVLANPSDDGISDVEDIKITTPTDTGGESNSKTLYDDGRIVDLDDDATLESGDTATVNISFSGPVDGNVLDAGLKYEFGSSVNATRITDTVGGTSISSYRLVASGQDVDLVFESPKRLDRSTIDVNLSGERNDALDDASDFTESGTGPYTYTADVISGTDGWVSANLTSAKTDTGESVEGTPYEDSVLVATGGDYLWTTGSDWDNATSSNGIIHTSYGDHDPDEFELGYTTNDSGLVAYYPLDDPGGAPDESEHGDDNDGDVMGSPSESVGIFGSHAYDLDGSDDYVKIDDSASLEMSDTDEVTVSAWIRRDSIQSGWRAIFQHSDTSYNLQLADGNDPEFTIHDGTWYSAASGSSLAVDSWYHLVGTFDDDTARLYVDGTEVDSESGPDEIDSAAGMDAGLGENIDEPGRHLHGSIDEVRVYNRSLDGGEVADLHGSAFTGEITTGWKNGTSVDFDDAELKYDVSKLPGETVEVTVHANRSSPETSDTLTLSDGAGTTEIDGLSGGSAEEYRLTIRLDSPPPDSSPTVRTLEVTAP